MHLLGLTEAGVAAWAQGRGASGGSSQALARHLVARMAGRTPAASAGAPPQALLRAASAELDESLPVADAHEDPDGTVRFAVRLADGALVETVLIRQAAGARRANARTTVCVSSQAGCARGCVFCETGRLGLQRNLTAAEIVAQFALTARHLAARGEAAPQNVVFMGMGEPLDNLDEVLQAIAVLRERRGFAVPERRITVSTVGIVPKMDELYARTSANLAVSLHAIDQAERLRLLPVAKRWPLAELRAAIARAPRTVLIQWTLIAGINDRDIDIEALLSFCKDIDVRVNLIPLNPGPRDEMTAPPLERCRQFQRALLGAGVRTMLRMPHGQSIGGACGQLAGRARS